MPLAEVFERVTGPDSDVEFVAFDGSKAGSSGAPGIRISVKDPTAVSYLAQAPGALGLARAYVSGHLDVDGDMYTALARLASAQRIDLSVPERLAVLSELGGPRLLVHRPAAYAGGQGQPQVDLGTSALTAPRRQRDLAPL
jgi:cyclopropane-fatty-acyl-phospholipid synthase